MGRRLAPAALLALSVAAAAATLSAQQPAPPSLAPAYAPAAPPAFDAIGVAVGEWNRLRQSDALPFGDYARFLLAHPGWPGEAAMRRAAERRLQPDVIAPAEVAAFFARFDPLTVGGRVRQAEALNALGRRAEANAAARRAWTEGVAANDDEARLVAFFSGAFTPADHDRRMDMLLWSRATAAAGRQIARVGPPRRDLLAARLALQTRQPGADALRPELARDPGYVVDRALYLREAGQSAAARAWLAQPRTFNAPPIDAVRYLDALLGFARAAAADNQQTLAHDIARNGDLAFPAGTVIRTRPLAERDPYTSLVWIGGTAADKLGRPRDAAVMYDRYARAAQSPSTQTKGLYWAGRARSKAGEATAANALYGEAARHPDSFYGQLAAERLGRRPALPLVAPAVDPGAAARAAFDRSELVRAARWLGRQGRWSDQTQFLRAIAADARTANDQRLAADLARAIGRPDLSVMVARNARNLGADPAPFGFPQVALPAVAQPMWSMAHAISRQESMFDREATSRVGAKGLMQLMPGTAREQAGKIGLPYDYARLTSDPQYNITLGSTFFSRMLALYGGNHVLAVAAYNAGPGNVRKFIARNGDPRMPGVDVLTWIEAIPLSETRGYVQRVLENAVVYDSMNPRPRTPADRRLSTYLGKSTAG